MFLVFSCMYTHSLSIFCFPYSFPSVRCSVPVNQNIWARICFWWSCFVPTEHLTWYQRIHELRSNILLFAFDYAHIISCLLYLAPYVMPVTEFLLSLCQCIACYLNCASSPHLNWLSLHFWIKLLVFKTFLSLVLSYLIPPVSHYSVKHHFPFASVCTIG